MTDRLTSACRTALESWTAPSADQEGLRLDFLDQLRRRQHGWARECPGAHLTSSALICARGTGEVLLTLHAKLGRWLQTGGHLEADDADLAAAALREATEESGLTGLRLDPVPLLLSRHEVPCGPVRPCFHLDVQYLAVADRASAPSFGAESHDMAWFAADNLPEVDDSVRDLVAAAAVRLASDADEQTSHGQASR